VRVLAGVHVMWEEREEGREGGRAFSSLGHVEVCQQVKLDWLRFFFLSFILFFFFLVIIFTETGFCVRTVELFFRTEIRTNRHCLFRKCSVIDGTLKMIFFQFNKEWVGVAFFVFVRIKPFVTAAPSKCF